MENVDISRLKSVNNFESLIEYLRNELDWPIEIEDAEELTYDYDPKELGIDEKYATKIINIKQLRPLSENQLWGIFYIKFETKKLPIVVLRRILKGLIRSRRTAKDRMKTWDLANLIFISSLGEINERKISFAHFTDAEFGLPVLKTFSWDPSDTYFHFLQNKMDLEKLHWPDDESDRYRWYEQWSSAFILKPREVIRTSQQLAIEMAHLASQIRDQVKTVYEYEIADGQLHNLFNNFKKVLIHDLEIDMFADMYAQTIAYGLFSARVTHEADFATEDITSMIPHTNPFLRKLFEECTKIDEIDEQGLDLEELGITELVRMLKENNIEAVISDFGKQKKGEDPVIHFYELFLKEYDPKQKVKRGVFYTPDPVVSFIVRSVDQILKKEFKCSDGLADNSTVSIKHKRPAKKGSGMIEDTKKVPKVQILDPATGTGTFLKYVIDEIKKTFDKKHKDLNDEELNEKWNKYVLKHLLPRLFGFELMMAPYAVAHLKLELKLAETGYNFKSTKRLGVYLTNTLEGTHKGSGTLDAYFNWLAEEGHKANVIKYNYPISIIIGNPPYAGHSANDNPWIRSLISDYRFIQGNRLDLAQGKWLQNDYVKFLRFAEWRINRTGYGILAFITDHSYLDGDTFPGLRYHLLNSFNKIFIINLHGNIRKRRLSPDGIKNENIFDIEEGVSIIICFKKKSHKSSKNKIASTYYLDCWGDRENKYKLLNENDLYSINWETIKPKDSNYFFIKRDSNLSDEFNNYPSLKEILSSHGKPAPGFLTTHDEFAITFSKKEIKNNVKRLLKTKTENEARNHFKLCSQDQWKYKEAKKSLSKYNWEYDIIKCLYRPFDYRYTVYNPNVLVHRRERVSNHLLTKDNIALATTRLTKGESFKHAFITNHITEVILLSSKTSNNAFIFPLYNTLKSKNSNNITYLDNNLIRELCVTFSMKFVRKGKGDLSETIGPLDIIGYIYAILYSQGYRDRYRILLEKDFPHVPFTKDLNLFAELSNHGSHLIQLHLMESIPKNKLQVIYNGEGNDIVKKIPSNRKILPTLKNRKSYVMINDQKYFSNVPQKVWEFKIGGYQVCYKWLKYRIKKKLSSRDINHFINIILIINETIQEMEEIDNIIEKYGGWPIK